MYTFVVLIEPNGIQNIVLCLSILLASNYNMPLPGIFLVYQRKNCSGLGISSDNSWGFSFILVFIRGGGLTRESATTLESPDLCLWILLLWLSIFFIVMEDFGIPYLAVFKDVTAVWGSPVVRAYQASKYLIVVNSIHNSTQVGSRHFGLL